MFYIIIISVHLTLKKGPSFKKDGIIRIELSEDVSFLNKANIQRALNKIPNNSQVIIDAGKCKSMDQDVVEIIEDFATHCKYSHIQLEYIEPKVESKKVESPLKALERAIKHLPQTLRED